MKTRLLAVILVASFSALRADPLKAPIFEETFNVAHSRIDYRNGAGLGGPGTGVSGKPADRAYMAVPRSTEQERNGPGGLAVSPIAPDSLSAFTCAFWYFLDEQGPELQVPLSTAGVLFLMHERGFEVRIEQSAEQPKQISFTPGPQGPHAGWRDRGRWIFAAFSWDQAKNTLTVHQGTPDKAVAFMRDVSRDAPGKPTLPRGDLARDPETIGNTFKTFDRPLSGRMDNVRLFDRVLDRAELEKIRQADLGNVAPTLK